MTLLNRLQPGGGLMDHLRVAAPRGSIIAGVALAVVWALSRHLDKGVRPPSSSSPPPPPSPPPTGRAPAGKDTDSNATNTRAMSTETATPAALRRLVFMTVSSKRSRV